MQSTSMCSASALPGRVAEARQHVEHAVRHARLRRQCREAHRGQRRLLRRLEHDGVAGRQRRRELPRRHDQREVPRHDRRDDADRLARDQRRARRGPSARPRRTPCRSPRRTSGCSARSRECRRRGCRRSACPCRASRAAPARRDGRAVLGKRCSTFLRSAGAWRDHRPSSKARRAAVTARSTSGPSPAATRAITRPSIGLTLSKVAPERQARRSARR